ncbi:MAG: hypothetical protein AAB602_02900 [Patescibacteria group bacterium]
MSFSLVYLLSRAIYRIGDFFHHWYVDGSRVFIHSFISKLENLDKGFALQVTIKHFFEPLYKDYSIVGRILGIPFRAVRISIGGIIYLIFSVIFLAMYLAWLLIPAVIITYAILNLAPNP